MATAERDKSRCTACGVPLTDKQKVVLFADGSGMCAKCKREFTHDVPAKYGRISEKK